MRFSPTLILNYTLLLLSVLTCHSLGSLSGNIIRQQILNRPYQKTFAPRVSAPPAIRDTVLEKAEFEPILNRNMFGAQRAAVAVASTTESMTSLKISLVGTMLYPSISFAFISLQGREQDYSVFPEGSCFDPSSMQIAELCEINHVMIMKIENRKVTLTYHGKTEILIMPDAQETSFAAVSAAAAVSSEFEPKNITSTGNSVAPPPIASGESAAPDDEQTVFHFKREWVDEQLANFDSLLRDARVVPTTKDSKTLFMFKFIKPKSLYETLGLKKGDVILEINGHSIDNISKALSLLEVLRSEREIVLTVERDGQPRTFNYYID
ncbi:MAG: PDZ domain-containing protein [SAR324 cluster bacterium]|nr:PDZ domain-containing protein [SAR324 cluster bacterium]